jgi:hypothetical protein
VFAHRVLLEHDPHFPIQVDLELVLQAENRHRSCLTGRVHGPERTSFYLPTTGSADLVL